MELSQFENAERGSFNVLRQDGSELLIEGKPVVIHMHGKGSKPQVAADHVRQRENTVSMTAALQGRVKKNAEEDGFRRQAEYLAKCTISIDNWPFDGGPLALYMNPKLGYITAQAEKFLADDANFMQGSGPS